MTTEIFGVKLLELLPKQNRNGLLEKMLRELLTSPMVQSCSRYKKIWKAKASKSNVLLFQLQASVLGIKGKEFGSLPTPTAMDHIDRKGMRPSRAATNRKTGYLSEMIKMYPTPTSQDHSRNTIPPSIGKTRGMDLSMRVVADQMRIYPTPHRLIYGTPTAQASRAALTDRGKGNLGEQVHGDNNAKKLGGKLNPNFVEFLMAYPTDWTKIEQTELKR